MSAACLLMLGVVGLGADSPEAGSAEPRYDRAGPAEPAELVGPAGTAEPRGGTAPAAGTAVEGNFPPGPGLRYSFWVDTKSRVEKLDSELDFPRGHFDLVVPITSDPPPVPIRGNLTLPSTEGYFVTFGFMPVTNTVEMIPDGESEGTIEVKFGPPGDDEDEDILPLPRARTKLTLELFLELSDVRVDGKALDVGPNCRTADPLTIVIESTVYLQAQDPGQQPPATDTTSTFALPPLSGCGATEDLDPLLTGLISGPGNDLFTRLSIRCSPASDPTC
ncbi:hypothetical protein FB471_2580 [Amycolatopsis cihanbeyliensis]|uniref:Uncharacterized protein n=2 Tax=Amycolatopsis cihanbeyliensis TaxID=1128664 RepID=A0A542DIL2_AMYCI|nr:hypothetical protein FB471_2580 [Amycolatopsis cihanbeyliensis]